MDTEELADWHCMLFTYDKSRLSHSGDQDIPDWYPGVLGKTIAFGMFLFIFLIHMLY